MRIALQQRQRLYREGLADLLTAKGVFRVVGRVETAAELIAVCDRTRPDVAVLEWDAREAPPRQEARHLRTRLPELRLVALRTPAGPHAADPVRWPGVVIVPRDAGLAGIMDAIRAPRPPRSVPSLHRSAPALHERLTPRERAVISLIGMGYTSQEIAERLGISLKTVHNHKQRIFAKLGVQNQAHAVSVAIRRGMLVPRPFVDSASAS